MISPGSGAVGKPDAALVGELAAALGVEGGAVEHHLHVVALADRADVGAPDEQTDDARLGRHLVVPGERRGARRVEHRPVGRQIGVTGPAGLGRRLGTLALLAHQPAEAGLVHRDALLLRHLERQLDREAIRVVKLERLRARQAPTALGPLTARCVGRWLAERRGVLQCLLDELVEDRRARAQRLAERLLLGVGDGADALEPACHLGIGGGHRVAAHRQQLGQHRVVDAQQAHRANGAPQQPPEHVPARLVARRDTVADQHEGAAHVVGDHPQPYVVRMLAAVLLAGQVGGPAQHGEDLVDLVEVVDALQQEGDALEPHAGVDVLGRQVAKDREVGLAGALAADVLHEDEVPELEIAVARTLDVALRAELRAAVDEDLAARAARTRHAHRPEVLLLAEPHDALLGQPGDALPEPERLVVLLVDAGQQLGLGEPEAALALWPGHQLPGKLDRALLEVVAEGEVAVHLEEGAVPGGQPDLLDVEGAYALLHAGGPPERRGLLAQEVGLERHHPGVDEQQIGVVEQEGGRRHDGVVPLAEEVQPPTLDLGGLHQPVLLR
jgi:hypothetical protein